MKAKEEPKQDLEKEMFELEQELDIPSSMRWHNSKPKQEIKLEDIFNDEKKQGVKDLIDAHKQETLEEAAERYAHNYFNMHETNNYKALKQGYEAGAKEMAERMYSDEEVLNLWKVYIKLNDGFMIRKSLPTRLEELIGWFEQNKKK
jgi:exonuclease VII large subunit